VKAERAWRESIEKQYEKSLSSYTTLQKKVEASNQRKGGSRLSALPPVKKSSSVARLARK